LLSKAFFIFIGGGLGSILRYLINQIVSLNFLSQLATILVNTTGSFLFGFLYIVLKDKSSLINLFLLTGFLGGFTTFSQFSFDFLELNENNVFTSILYLITSVTFSIIAAGFGILIAQRLK